MDNDLDFIDLKILEILQQDGRASHSAVAEAVGLSQPSVHERVKKLEQRGVIRGYAAVVDPEALGLETLAFISVRLTGYEPDDVAARVQNIPQVLETHHIAGEECFILAHDAQMDEFLDAARIGRVIIHQSCHIGSRWKMRSSIS